MLAGLGSGDEPHIPYLALIWIDAWRPCGCLQWEADSGIKLKKKHLAIHCRKCGSPLTPVNCTRWELRNNQNARLWNSVISVQQHQLPSYIYPFLAQGLVLVMISMDWLFSRQLLLFARCWNSLKELETLTGLQCVLVLIPLNLAPHLLMNSPPISVTAAQFTIDKRGRKLVKPRPVITRTCKVLLLLCMTPKLIIAQGNHNLVYLKNIGADHLLSYFILR